MTIAIGSDHAGFKYKEAFKVWLFEHGYTVRDFGTDSEVSCDYPDFCHPVAAAVSAGKVERGIVIGGSGNGEAIVANKHPGVRCGVCWTEQVAIWNRMHNDANVLSIGERTVPLDLALKILETWLSTPFEGGRHIPRIAKIELK